MRKLILTVFTFFSLVSAPAISYAENVKIGVLYPLTGPVAQVGKDACLLYTSPSPRDGLLSRMPSSA